jgi:hypothetical protein
MPTLTTNLHVPESCCKAAGFDCQIVAITRRRLALVDPKEVGEVIYVA